MRRYLPFAIIGAVLLIAAGSALLIFRSKHSTTPIKIAAGKPGAEPSHVRGAANARVTLEEFGDFQCKPCGILATTLLKVEHDYGKSVRVIFRQFPITSVHAHALDAAFAAEAAGLQGRFWEMHDLLFQNSAQWSMEGPRPRRRVIPNISGEETAGVRAIFAGYAATLGLDVERFKRDMDTEEVQARIKADQERAGSIGVNQTPVLFVNGTQIPFESLGLDNLHGRIDAELSGKASTPGPQLPTASPPE